MALVMFGSGPAAHASTRALSGWGMSPFSMRSTVLLVLIDGGHVQHLRASRPLPIGLIALGLACLLFVPLAKRYGWGNEGRLTRHLSRPQFEDESRKSS